MYWHSIQVVVKTSTRENQLNTNKNNVLLLNYTQGVAKILVREEHLVETWKFTQYKFLNFKNLYKFEKIFKIF